MHNHYAAWLERVLPLAEQAGQHLTAFYARSVQVQTKADNTPVTEADLFVSRFLTEKLTALFPHVPVLSEENCRVPFEQRRHWQRYWLIDPLDGTQQFINRTDQFAVLISLIDHHRPVLGIIHAPILGITYYAIKNGGAFKHTAAGTTRLQGKPFNPHLPLNIAVGETTPQAKVRSILATELNVNFTVLGSSSLKSGLVAEGGADAYIRLGKTGEWDTACGEILLAESGGSVFTPTFQPLTYNQRPSLINPPFIMTADRTADWQRFIDFSKLK